jgi:hypothetical protein
MYKTVDFNRYNVWRWKVSTVKQIIFVINYDLKFQRMEIDSIITNGSEDVS